MPNRAEQSLFNVDDARGRITLLDRGKVPFARKVQHAQQAGALGVIIIDDASCTDRSMDCYDGQLSIPTVVEVATTASASTILRNDPPHAWRGVRIPSVLISAADGERLRSFMALSSFEVDGERNFITES